MSRLPYLSLIHIFCARCCDETVDISFYDKNRKRLYDALTAYGYEMPKPEGAFYLFVKTPTENDLEFVEKIKEHRILLTSGSGFGCPGSVSYTHLNSRKALCGAGGAILSGGRVHHLPLFLPCRGGLQAYRHIERYAGCLLYTSSTSAMN